MTKKKKVPKDLSIRIDFEAALVFARLCAKNDDAGDSKSNLARAYLCLKADSDMTDAALAKADEWLKRARG